MDNKYGGMTVNERLYVAGLIDDFYLAVEKKNVEKVVSVLKAVELGEDNTKAILKSKGLINDI